MLRSTLTHGSSRVNIRRLVTAWVRTPRRSSATPQASPTRAQTRRAARRTAAVRNWSAVAPSRRSICPNASSAGMPAASRWRRYSTAVATATARASTSVAPASCSTVASTVMARQPSSRAHSRTRSASGARSGSVPSRAAAPNGSRPRLPPTDSLPADVVEQGPGRCRLVGDRRDDDRGEVEPHVGEGLGQVGRRRGRRAPTCSHTDVTPCSRSSSTAARVATASGSSCSWRTSHGVLGVAQRATAGERHRAGHAEVTLLAQVEGVDLEAALEVAAQGGLGVRAVEPVVVGAALVEHRGDEALPVLSTLRREPGRESGGPRGV